MRHKLFILTTTLMLLSTPLFAKDFWVGIFSEKSPHSSQTFISSSSLEKFQNAITKAFKQGFQIIDIQYGDGTWSAIMAETNLKDQLFFHSRDSKVFDTKINNYQKEGYKLHNVDYGKGYWTATLNKNSEYQKTQFIKVRYSEPIKPIIRQKWKESYNLVDIERAEGYIYMVFGKGGQHKGQSYTLIEQDWVDVVRSIQQYWKDGYRLQNLEYLPNGWFCLFDKEDHGKQLLTVNKNIIRFRSAIEKKWNQNMTLTDFAHGRD